MKRDETRYCVVCGREPMFRFDPTIVTPQLREAWGISDRLAEAFNRKESMFCSNCGCSLRIRRLAAVLIETFSEMRGRSYDSFIELLKDQDFLQLKIAEINACGVLHSYLETHPNLYYSEWFNDIKPGEAHDGIRCEDLQRLSYPDGFFDIILTSETFEHIPDPDKAWREICRTLKIGGYHIFTIPVPPSQPTTVKRANLVDEKRQNLLEPAYHGVWGDENMFVYTDFGMDLVDKLDGIGLKTAVFYQNAEDELDVAVVFRSRKSKENWEATSAGESNMLEWTGERYLPWVEEASIGYEHLHRYAYATQFVANKKVLDIASGEGYGSYLLSRGAESVVGVDIDKKAIRHAKNKYIKSNLQFKTGTITDIPIEGRNIFDVIVCFEAIEHIEDHESLLKEVKRLLTKDGLFIVSTPNKWAYSDEPKYENPFHVHELYFDEFTELFQRYFRQVKILGQRIYCNSNIWPIFSGGHSKLAEYVIERNPREFAFVEGDKRIPLYFIALASDADVNESPSNLVDISNELIKQKDVAIGNLIATRDTLEASIRTHRQALEERDQQLNQLGVAHRQALEERDQQLNQLGVAHRQALEERDQQLNQLGVAHRQVLEERDQQLNQLGVAHRQALEERDQQLNQLGVAHRQALEEREEQIKSLTTERDRFKQEAEQLLATVQEQQNSMGRISEEIYQLQHSESYRFGLFCTWPLRKLWRFTRGLFEGKGHTRVPNDIVSPEPQPSILGETEGNVVAEVGKVPEPQTQQPESAALGTAQYHTAALDDWRKEWYREGSDYYEPMSNSPMGETEIRLIAFYLPQFHPIPDNDRWWGKGFTEWTNVTKAKPQYIGHYQPHLPGELGFYDLRLIEVQKRQVEIAKHYGIHGFCYYYYWFSGKRVLERPLDQVLQHPDLDLPFCICWANENWTRRWDGSEQDVLLAQEHRPDDDLELIQSLERVLKDKRYIKVDGKPLLIVYRVDILPSPKETVKTWRDHCSKAGLGEIYLVGAKTFGFEDPVSLGFDAAIEFPPHNIAPLEITADVTPFNPAFQGHVYSYRDFVEKAIRVDRTQHTVFCTVMSNWDNTPRRAGAAYMFADSTPSLYQSWLEAACDYTVRNLPAGKRLVFINAWNEWAEGAHLEPDRKYGYAYLNATANAIRKYDVSKRVRVNRAKRLISVVLPSYNHQQYVEIALDSLKNQTMRDLEIIVVDDGSTDATPEVVQTFIEHNQNLDVRLLKQSNGGAHAAINRGVAEAAGDYIAILNSDDFYHHERLEVLLNALRQTDSKLAFSDIEIIDGDGAPVNSDYACALRQKINERQSFSNIGYALLDCNIAISTGNLMFKRELFDLVGGFSDLKFCHDWDFILTALRFTDPIFVDKALYYYRLHTSNTISEAHRNGDADGDAARVLAKFFAFEQSQSQVRRNFPSRKNDGPYFAEFVRQHGFDKYIAEANHC